MHRDLAWGAFALSMAMLGFFLGATVGFWGGEVNTEIDFCADSSSRRYIRDEIIRKEACERRVPIDSG
jgi:hypothetical protein